MKLYIWCACLVMMLLISPLTFGEILESNDWDGNCGGDEEGSTPSAHADGSDPYEYKWGIGWEYTYTTEDAMCNWDYEVYAYAEGELTLRDNDWASAEAGADTEASCPYDANENTAYIDLYDSGDGRRVWDTDLDDDDPGGVYKQGYGRFDAYEGVSVEHDAFAKAEVANGSSSSAYAHGCARATGYLEED